MLGKIEEIKLYKKFIGEASGKDINRPPLEFEGSLIKERQLEDIILAKKKGLYNGSKAALNQKQISVLQLKISLGIIKVKIAHKLNISRLLSIIIFQSLTFPSYLASLYSN